MCVCKLYSTKPNYYCNSRKIICKDKATMGVRGLTHSRAQIGSINQVKMILISSCIHAISSILSLPDAAFRSTMGTLTSVTL